MARCWGVIPAAGAGVRMGYSQPKQHVLLGGKTLLQRSLQALLGLPGMQGVVIAFAPDDPRAADYRDTDERVRIVQGGAQRADSVLAALHYLQEIAYNDDWVLVHDAARPCLAAADGERLVTQVVAKGCGGLLAEPVVDTLKRVDADGYVQATVDRRGLWRAQTPQMFALGQLHSVLAAALADGVEITDEASAMEWGGHPVLVVPGSPSNFKVTVPGDLELAAFYLGINREGQA
ncbi:MAG TPA: 2-C-methyl-D-erythritol 4-phosphate cytidylyltransferase [Halieaceae bacterium]|uniref:2-C-methyl-D-erythritol 4-phosphate cytidylyltransferase n=1 Tax=Haliea sp. TaxID=1932666 RepID=UPI000C5D531C|nr:2-C-methyl-D-erythritol 4-phosphate cytidylyltransferase [Haliea sp.]HAN69251.1 2-C-methyl-D-erythritol 4-phosphate cytidylyltransferase [Halieaceae bacterium]MAD64963.1 2-C-methyl-D-erythritol 4-phosphate cytidylyltransferase [Haliea sp.]MAY94585.1 2-C-methyl-D-erythritol 4-phosphate cytidylyltransferase [Haliea sp.]MBP71590.1 2-C-methyl-D-erythritol 4-phosphate cytidylyltransferase [Haliea sp.]HBM83020.1 2-C-methyl-D-erythritol 4-phosphate cytidylyltransferase [Halieaceae bacterium]